MINQRKRKQQVCVCALILEAKDNMSLSPFHLKKLAELAAESSLNHQQHHGTIYIYKVHDCMSALDSATLHSFPPPLCTHSYRFQPL